MPAYAPFNWYETPLYYDIVFDVDTGRETDFLCDVWSRHATSRGRRVLEPACGSGKSASFRFWWHILLLEVH